MLLPQDFLDMQHLKNILSGVGYLGARLSGDIVLAMARARQNGESSSIYLPSLYPLPLSLPLTLTHLLTHSLSLTLWRTYEDTS